MKDYPVFVYMSPKLNREIHIYNQTNGTETYQLQADILKKTFDALPDFYDLVEKSSEANTISSAVVVTFSSNPFISVFFVSPTMIECCVISQDEYKKFNLCVSNSGGVCDWGWKTLNINSIERESVKSYSL